MPQATGVSGSTDSATTGDDLEDYGAATPEDSTTFLRGWQYTNENGTSIHRVINLGIVKFQTVYPGWYSGRALHIHLKVFTGGVVSANGTYSGAVNKFTGQMFFNVYYHWY
jgi:protocatechuate 3,4-dioxygenase beta subunit